MRDSRPGASYESKIWFSPDPASSSHSVGVGGVIDDAETDKDGEKDIQKAVNRFFDVDVREFFYAENDEGGEGRPEGPGF